MNINGTEIDNMNAYCIIIKKDGDKWCAHFNDFENIQENDIGFGNRPNDAVTELFKLQVNFI